MNNNVVLFLSGITSGYVLSHLYDMKNLCITILKMYESRNSVKKISKNKYEICYTYNNKPYKIILPIIRGPQRIYKVVNQHNEDITDIIKEYLGPNENFLGFIYSPFDFNQNEITIHTINGNTTTFTKHEIIDINNI